MHLQFLLIWLLSVISTSFALEWFTRSSSICTCLYLALNINLIFNKLYIRCHKTCSSLFQFDKWTDGQRRRILTDLLERCSLSQQKFCSKQLQERVPVEALDFTTKLPRVLSLYIFSFLDPRSLCRCAQVKSSTYLEYKSYIQVSWEDL